MPTAEADLVQPPGVAGMFYPADADELAQTVDERLARPRAAHTPPKALIAPHAGYDFSGAVAGTAFASVAAVAGAISRVVLIGPSHRHCFAGLAVPSARAFATPLGIVPVDSGAVKRLLDLPGVATVDTAFAHEHSLEVELPFLQRLLGEFTIVPVVTGDVSVEAVDRALAAVWGGPETLVVVSSDLSHFYPYDEARELDRAAALAIETLRQDRLEDQHACGHRAIRGLLARARVLDMRATTLDLRNSGDTFGRRESVVGYGAFVLEYAAICRLDDTHRRKLLEAAQTSMRSGLRRGRPPEVRLGSFAPQLETTRASFVSVLKGDRLMGCVGSMAPHKPLVSDVVENAFKAAFADPRFPAVTAADLPELDVEISILSTPRPIPAVDEATLLAALRPELDGVIVEDGERRALFLPHVWEGLPDPRAFLARLRQKARLPADHWSNSFRAWRFTAERFGTSDYRDTTA
ncbi:MAG: AmmeMemoRadiSam system protein B [Acetobacterales bacterium]